MNVEVGRKSDRSKSVLFAKEKNSKRIVIVKIGVFISESKISEY